MRVLHGSAGYGITRGVFTGCGEQQSSADMDQDTDRSHTTIRPVGKSVDWSVSVDNQQSDEDIGCGSLVPGGLDW